MLDRCSENGHFCLVLGLGRIKLSPINILVVNFSKMPFISLREFLTVLSLLRIFFSPFKIRDWF